MRWQDDERYVDAWPHTYRHEKGLVDHPSDPGGITNSGVSLRWLKSLPLEVGDIDRDGDIDADDVRALAPDQIAQLFYDRFWLPNRFRYMPPVIGQKAFDMSVHMGPRQAVKLLQRALCVVENDDNVRASLLDDGFVGNKTLAAIADRSSPNAAWAVRVALRSSSEMFFRYLASVDPEHGGPFIDGWVRRARW
tara:strand:- start:3834 stop:4412 length:579 start_codon:yes stop_codon:yes gene_type:complete